MIVTHSTENNVVMSNVGATDEFTIRSSPKAFSILSSGLYKNKIRAIIRELCCNAVDSHIAAGKADVPFEVHLPSVLEPWFSVQDYGLGLDDNEVRNVCTVYFASTKNKSNLLIGGLGLGFKSPYSYTENFTVTAVKHGVKRIYGAFINEQGVPSVALMYQENTDEPNGVEVKFNVAKVEDYAAFGREIDVLRWFKHPYTLLNQGGYRVSEVVYLEKDIIPGVHLQDYSYQSKTVAIMGNIAYPLDNVPLAEEKLGAVHKLLSHRLVIEFDIGELEFVASREELSFVPSTYTAIKAKLEALNSVLYEKLETKVMSEPTPWQQANALVRCRDIYKTAALQLATKLQNPLVDVRNGSMYHANLCFSVGELLARGLTVTVSTLRHNNTAAHHTPRMISGTLTHTILPDLNTLVVFSDIKTVIRERVIKHYKMQTAYAGWQIVCVSHNSADMSERQAAYDELIAKLHNPPNVIKASTVPAVPRVRAAAAVSNAEVPVYTAPGCSYDYNTNQSDWSRGTVRSAATEHVYVDLDRYTAVGKTGGVYALGVQRALMRTAGIKWPDVYGLSKTRKATLTKNGTWVHIDDYIVRETAAAVSKHSAAVAMAQCSCMRALMGVHMELSAVLPKESALMVVMDKYRATYKAMDMTQVDALIRLSAKAGLQQDNTRFKEVEKDASDVKTRYPILLSLIDRSVDANDIAHYVVLVDSIDKTH